MPDAIISSVRAAQVRAAQMKYLRGPKRRKWLADHREDVKASQRKYAVSKKGRAAQARWAASEKGRANACARMARLRAKPETKAKERARGAVAHAIQTLRLKRPERCTQCNKRGRVEAHHFMGYAEEHKLTVKWLCSRCHKRAENHA